MKNSRISERKAEQNLVYAVQQSKGIVAGPCEAPHKRRLN